MSLELICSCGNKKFSVIAHVAEEWIVDHHGEFLREGDPTFREVTHRPEVGSDRFNFTCTKCGAEAKVIES